MGVYNKQQSGFTPDCFFIRIIPYKRDFIFKEYYLPLRFIIKDNVKMKKFLLVSISVLMIFGACTDKKNSSNKLKDGNWHAQFNIKDGSIPFIFEVKNGSSDSSAVITLINGKERVSLDGINYKGDSVYIPIKAYDTELKGVIAGDTIKGIFKRLFSESDAGIPFIALYGNNPRFASNGSPSDSLSGKWDIQFISKEKTENYVGIFSAKDEIATGSILTNSGDFRFLEGVTDKDGFKLSAFAGLSPYLIEGKFTDKDHFEGRFITSRGVQVIKGTRNDKAAMADPYSLTTLKKGYNSLDFRFKNLQGEDISLSDSKYKDKVVIVSVLGSWCPNCLDEMEYLSPWYKENKDRGVEIVGIAFERKDDQEYVNKVLSNLVKKYDTTYEILFAGKLGDEEKALPAIDKLKSYPTTIFIDKKGKVRKIHTGFNGPATGLFYEEFKTDFNKLVDDLLSEK